MSRYFLASAIFFFSALGHAGRAKVIDVRTLPTTPSGLAQALTTERDAAARANLSLLLESSLRLKGQEIKDPKVVDELLTQLLDGVFNQMSMPNAVWSWSKDDFGPRGDIVCKERALIFPGRVSAEFSKKFVKTPKGKRLNRTKPEPPCLLEVVAAKSEEEFHQWTASQGWGVYPLPSYQADSVAQQGVLFLSPGHSSFPSPRHERPIFIGFFRQPKAGEAFSSVALEAETAADWRKQEINLLVPDAKPSELEKKLRVALLMESVRLLPPREAFIGQEQRIFRLEGQGADTVDKQTWPALEPYLTSPSAMQRAAALSKQVKLGVTQVSPATFIEALKELKHPAARYELMSALMKQLGPGFSNGVAPSPDDEATLRELSIPKEAKARVLSIKVFEEFAHVQVGDLPYSGVLFRRTDTGWEPLGQIK